MENKDLLLAGMSQEEIIQSALRWQALVGCNHIRILGGAGFKESGNSDYKHFGMEIWTHHALYYGNEGKSYITAFADQLIENKIKQQTMKIVFTNAFSPNTPGAYIGKVTGKDIGFDISKLGFKRYGEPTEENIIKYIKDFGVCVDVEFNYAELNNKQEL